MKQPLIVDTHAHFGVPENKVKEKSRKVESYQAQSILGEIENLKKLVGSKNNKLIADKNLLEDYLACMTEQKISISWIHQLSFEHVLGYEILSNENIAKAIQKYPNKLKGFASVNPHKKAEAVKELDYAIHTLGLHGFKLNPNDYGGFYLNDRELLYPLYEKCSEYQIPVSVHTGITPGSVFRMKHNYPLLLDDVAVDFPDLTIIVEHMGYPWNDLCYYMVGRHKNMYITVTAVANIMIHTRPNAFRMELAKMIGQVGSEKILWGSDWTATPNIEEVLSYLQNIKIPLPMKLLMGIKDIKDQDIENILGKNAMRILS